MPLARLSGKSGRWYRPSSEYASRRARLHQGQQVSIAKGVRQPIHPGHRGKAKPFHPRALGFFTPTAGRPSPANRNSTMTQLKKGQSVKARTIRGTATVAGKVQEIIETTKGLWVTVQPDAKDVKPFKTRPALCTPA